MGLRVNKRMVDIQKSADDDVSSYHYACNICV